MERFRRIILLFLVLSAAPLHAEKPEHRKVAEYYAPVIYQETKSAVLDFVTKFDFDGDWNGANNWKHAYQYELPANVYYAVIESANHYFITYTFFHPRDYTARAMEGFAPKTEHENDMEGCTLAIEKGEGPWGKPILLETLAHDHFYKYDNPFYPRVRQGAFALDGSIVFLKADKATQREPAIFIESEGHGVKAATKQNTDSPGDFQGVIYHFAGRGAEVPRSSLDKDVSYELISIEDTLWVRRMDIGSDSLYCCADEYKLPNGEVVRIGSSFNGPIGSCSAKPPWGWDEAKDTIEKGDWFRDPISAYNQQLQITGLQGDYRHNPYRSIDSKASGEQVASLCAESTESKTVKEAVASTLLGVGKVLLSGGLDQKKIGDKATQLFLTDTVLLEWANKSDFERWDWNKDLSKANLPSLVTDNFVDEMKIPLLQNFSFASPLFNAPSRYFDSLVMKYKCSVEGIQARLYWKYVDMPDFDESHSEGLLLKKSDRWLLDSMDLSKLKEWDKSKTISKIKLEIISPNKEKLATINPSQGDSSFASNEVVVNYIIFDRDSFADTFEQ
jgi:hypothetical protein